LQLIFRKAQFTPLLGILILSHINLEKVHKVTRIGSRITIDFKIMVVINKVFREILETWITPKINSKRIISMSTVDYNESWS
jgi:hypothetical protein